MKVSLNALPLVIAAMLLSTFTFTFAAEAEKKQTAFEQLMEHYEPAREALTQDSMDGVTEQGRQIESILAELTAKWSVEAAGIQDDMSDEVRSLLPALGKASANLATAKDIESARDAFYELSKGLVRWRKAAVTDDKPVVAYCSMARRSWLQPAGDITNPYHGQSMPRCGEVVDD